MGAQHHRRLLGRRNGHHLQIPSHITKSISNIADNLPGEALISVRIGQTKGDAIRGMCDHGPVTPIPAVWSSMQRIDALRMSWLGVFVGENVIRGSVENEGGILDSVCISTWNASEMRMLAVDAVVRGIIEASYNVPLTSRGVIDEEVGDGSSVGDEVGADIDAADFVFAVCIGASG